MLKKRKNQIIVLIIILIVGFAIWKLSGNRESQSQYQTAEAEKGTLVISVSASGQVSAANNSSVTTQASGVVTEVYVENGQKVLVGDKIAALESDLDGNLRATQAWASYQNAQNSLESANANLYQMQSSLFTSWQTYMDKAQSSTYQNPDGTPNTSQRQAAQYLATNDDWLAAEAKYKNQQNVINQAQTSLNATWLNYQQASPVIYAPISGTVTGLSLQQGTVLLAQSNSSGGASSQKIASIKTDAATQIIVDLSEIDVTKVKVGNKATLSFDALPDKTYTGKIISIDTIGSISSGVTSYPAVISLDTQDPEILPNMSATAKIITNVRDNVLLVPSAAVITANNSSIVRVMKNGQITPVTVNIGSSNDTQTIITSGINEGDTVITNIINSSGGTRSSGTNSSPFGGFGGNRTFGGGGAVIRMGR